MTAIFSELPEPVYNLVSTPRLFTRYLTVLSLQANLAKRGQNLHPNDQGELERLTDALTRKPLPEKTEFYNSLQGDPFRELYKKTFLEL